MIRFDFLHSAQPSALRQLREMRVPRRLYSVVTALIGAVLIVCGVWLIESYRLRAALSMESHYAERLASSRVALATVHLKYRHLRELIALDARIREIRGSGNRTAEQLAQIGNRLPAHVWLTAIDSDNGLLIDGETTGLAALSQAVSTFALVKKTVPILVSATTFGSNSGPNLFRYQLRFEEKSK